MKTIDIVDKVSTKDAGFLIDPIEEHLSSFSEEITKDVPITQLSPFIDLLLTIT